MIRNFLHFSCLWLASLFFVLIAISAMVSGADAAVFLLVVVGLTLFWPPLRSLTDRRLNFSVKGWRLVPLFLLMLCLAAWLSGGAAMDVVQKARDKQEQAQAAAASAKKKWYFLTHKRAVLKDIAALRANKDFDGAFALNDQYLAVIQNKELHAARDDTLEAQLAWRLAHEPSMTPSERVAVYDRLVELNPDSREYQEGAIEAAALKRDEERAQAAQQ